MQIQPIILSGGSGSRLWPKSRYAYPKQFINFFDKKSLFQLTVERSSLLSDIKPIVICNEDHRFLVADQLREINISCLIVLEPTGRNTAPAAAAASYINENDSFLLVMPSDHLIDNNKEFKESILKSLEMASENKLVTFGINPSSAHTGYGYIEKGNIFKDGFMVDSFKEKPNKKLAEEYISSKNYFWNSGIFIFKSSIFKEQLKLFKPDILKYAEAAVKLAEIDSDLDFIRLDSISFSSCEDISLDYALMEKTKEASVIEMKANWNDLGSWSSLHKASKKDKNGNSINGDVILNDVSNSLFYSDDRLIAAFGIDDLAVVSTKDALLIANKENDQDVKKMQDILKEMNRSEWEFHKEVHRPWGKYESIAEGKNFQVKIITVPANKKLSVQMHYKRSEHWTIVSGVASVTIGEKTFDLLQNQSCYIPVETIHALENKSSEELILIEVQCGSYLGEDDIVRFEDRYGRT